MSKEILEQALIMSDCHKRENSPRVTQQMGLTGSQKSTVSSSQLNPLVTYIEFMPDDWRQHEEQNNTIFDVNGALALFDERLFRR